MSRKVEDILHDLRNIPEDESECGSDVSDIDSDDLFQLADLSSDEGSESDSDSESAESSESIATGNVNNFIIICIYL